jgi:hypothetical protein
MRAVFTPTAAPISLIVTAAKRRSANRSKVASRSSSALLRPAGCPGGADFGRPARP